VARRQCLKLGGAALLLGWRLLLVLTAPPGSTRGSRPQACTAAAPPPTIEMNHQPKHLFLFPALPLYPAQKLKAAGFGQGDKLESSWQAALGREGGSVGSVAHVPRQA
jgi:hypothetical protein